MSTYDPIRDRIVVFGGCLSSTGICGQQATYALTPTGWTKLTPATSPPGRAFGAMTWDPVRKQIVLFGGITAGGTRLNDTWGWDGSTWTQLNVGSTLPSARTSPTIAYSPDRNGVVLFGGYSSSTGMADNDTWVLGASGWVKVLSSGATGAPAYRASAAMAYLGNGAGGQLVLFGGLSCASSGCTNGAATNDTWVLPPSGAWVKQAPTQSPPALSAASFAYDSQLDANVLFGGINSGGYATNATWAWTGTNWLQAQDGIGAPDARYSAQIAVGGNGALNIMGGFAPARASSAPLDRWVYDAKTPVLGVSVSDPVEKTNLFTAGQVVTVKVVAQNTGLDDITTGDATSITAALNNGSKEVLSAVGSGVTWSVDPNDPTPACRSLPAGSAVGATVAGLIPTVTRAAVKAGCTATASFLAVVVGSPRGCALQVVTAKAGNLLGNSTDARTTLPICGNGLGQEDWWTYDTTNIGAGATANVNVGNGNLLVKQDDSTVIGSHGDLAFGLSRSYNSQDVANTAAGQGGVLGSGWQFQLGETGTAANGVSLGSLIVPTLNSVLDPLSVTYVDRDGTRFIFRPKTPSLNDVTGSLLSSAGSLTKTALTNLLQLPNVLGQDLNSILNSLSGSGQPLVCVDTTYTPPAGADMYLFRYLAFGGNSGASSCGSADPSKGVNIGYSLVRPDRIRYDFNLLGQLSDTVDGAGNTLFYTYDSANRPSRVYAGTCVPSGQPGPSGAVTGDACRQYTFRYGPTDPAGSRIDVTDPARRVTTYIVVPPNLSTGAPGQLKQVWNPDNPYVATGTPSISYTYSATNSPCPGSDATASTVGMLCSATDPVNAKTTFAYTKAVVGPDRVLSVTDRRANGSGTGSGSGAGNAVRYTYTDTATLADSNTPNVFGTGGTGCSNNAACERTSYLDINTIGSVGEIDQSDSANNNLKKQQAFFWDSDDNAAPCRQPDRVVDYNLCETITRGQPTGTPIELDKPTTGTLNGVTVADQATRFTYGDLGQVLVTQKIIDPGKPWTADNSATTTSGAHSQYVEAGDQIRAYDDTPRGSGAVDSATTGAGTSYGDSVKADKPSAFYRFAEPAGTNTAADSSGRGQNATYVANVPRGLPAGVPGDTAVGDPGPTQTADASGIGDFAAGTGGGSAFSVEAWQQANQADMSYVVCTPCNSGGLRLGRYNGAPFVFLISAAGSIGVVANASISDGRWHQVDYTYDGSSKAEGIKIYVDGDRVATTTYANDLNAAFRAANDPTQLGVNPNGVNGDGANLSDLALFSSELSAKRVAAHYNSVQNINRADASTLYAVTDQTATLTARGNDPANSSRWGDFLTTYKRDVPALDQDKATSAPTPNQKLTDDVCGSATTTNTGLLCATVMPASADVDKGDCPSPSVGTTSNPPGSAPHTCVTSTYNTFGEMTAKRSAKAHATGSNDKITFTYYGDTGSCAGAAARDCDLSAGVSAGGWLKAVTDQNGESLISAYDAAGNAARTWDRNATDGHRLDENWTDASNPIARYSEQDMANPVTSASISTGIADVEIVRGDGTVWGSGGNSYNELGDKTTTGGGTASATPVQAAGLDGVVQVVQNGLGGSAASNYVTTARTNTGAVYTWGNSMPVTVVGNLPPVISLAAGGGHTLALDHTGTVWAWGANGSGQLGTGSSGGTVSTPTKIMTGVSSIAAANNSSYAVKTDGTVWAWGDNAFGQLATGDKNGKSAPTKATWPAGSSKILAVYGGATTAYAISTDGSVWSWGDNANGALGTGTAATSVSTPAKITSLGPDSSVGPVRQIAGSIGGAAALMSDGSVRAWGLNNSGQLGSGTTASSTPIAVVGVVGQQALAGGSATYVSADAGGKLTIWGRTSSGQKGDGSTSATSSPSAMAPAQTISPFAAPWRYARSSRDAVGTLQTTVANPDGDVLVTTPARGTSIVTSAYDTTVTYNPNNQPVALLNPMERDGRDGTGALTGVFAPTTLAYDTFGNAVATTNPRGYATVTTFDQANRKTAVSTTRGTSTDAEGSACNDGTAAAGTNSFTSLQNGHVICKQSMIYDGNGQTIVASDALRHNSTTSYDGLGRATAATKPRGAGVTLTTYTNYDKDGDKLDVCPPRQTSGSTNTTSGCTRDGVYSTHMSYDPAGHVTTSTRYRAPASGPALSLDTTAKYDADGNAISSTDPEGRTTTTVFDLLDRKTAQSRPRGNGVRNTTRWRYDASGNVTAMLAPGAASPGSGADGALTVDGANNPKANPFRVPDNAQYTNVTVKNGGWITGQNGGLVFTATGSVTVCSSCGVTEAGDGQAGGAGGATGTDNGTAGNTAVSGGKPGVGSGAYAGGGGGGGHKTAGADGKTASTAGGAGGSAFGTSDFSDISTNYPDVAGGGGAGGGHSALTPSPGGKGGNGGGFIHITADTISIDGTVDASGAPGANSASSSGGGGGGAGGSIWLAAGDVSVGSSSLTVAGGAGGSTASGTGTNGYGGAGANGYVRVDTDGAPMQGADASGHLANITAYSYDADNRALDTVTGAQTTDASDPGPAGIPDDNGLTNTRSRTVYDPDGNVVATLPPQAFSGTGSPARLTANVDTAARSDFDLDGQPTVSYDPRYDTTGARDTGAGDDAGKGTNQQTGQCPTGATPSLAPGIGKYGPTVGVCTASLAFDANGNAVRQTLSTSSGQDNRYLARTYTDDDLVLTETMPDPTTKAPTTSRVTDHTYRYDGNDRPLKDTDANGDETTTSYTDDGLVSQTEDSCYDLDDSATKTVGKYCTWNKGTVITQRTVMTYDADGNLATKSQPRAQNPGQASGTNLTADDLTTSMSWTSDGLQESVRAPGLGHNDFDRTSYGYDKVGNKTSVAMPSSNAASADANNPDRLKTQYQFTDDNLVKVSSTPVTSSSFRNTVYNYNPAGQKVSTYICTTSSRISCPDATSGTDGRGLTRYTYGANGLNITQVAKATTATPTTISTAYDQAGRVKSIKDSSSKTTIASTYYLDGLLRTADDGTNVNTYAYDGDRHLTNRTDKTDSSGPTGGAVKRTSYSYGDAGLLSAMTSDVHSGKTTTVEYDAGGRMTRWTDTGGGTGQTRDYSYYTGDKLRYVNTKLSGDDSGKDRLDYRYAYDNDGNITSQAATGTANSNYTNTYAYNPAANTTSYSHMAGAADKTATTSTNYTWDHNANRLTANSTVTDKTTGSNSFYNQSWQYRADNSISKRVVSATGLSAVTQNYAYNQAGLLTTISAASSSAVCTTNTYDDLDRVKTVENTQSAACPGNKASKTTYTYDGVDRQRTATTSGSSVVTRTIYDGLSKTTTGQSKTSSGDDSKPDTLYQLTPDGHHVAMWQAGSTGSAASLLDDDSYGNTSLLINSGKTGAAATGCTVNYDPFGSPTAASSATATAPSNGVCSDGSDAASTGNTSWYRDERRDGNTGNYQLGTRTYDPANGNFSAPDNYRVSDSDTDLAVGTDPLTANTYSYVNGNPLNVSDPSGHCPDPSYCPSQFPKYKGPVAGTKSPAPPKSGGKPKPGQSLDLARGILPGLNKFDQKTVQTLQNQFFFGAQVSSGNYWAPKSTPWGGQACFGAYACKEAYRILASSDVITRSTVARAKHAAAYYCLDSSGDAAQKCKKDERLGRAFTQIENVVLAYGALASAGGGIAGRRNGLASRVEAGASGQAAEAAVAFEDIAGAAAKNGGLTNATLEDATNVANGPRLARQLRNESMNSVFTADGKLTDGAIADSRLIIPGGDLGSPDVINTLTSDGSSIGEWGKYTTRVHQSSYGDFEVHYYMNGTSGEVNYDYDYKTVFRGRH